MEYFVQGPDSYFLINFSLSTNYEITRFIFFVFTALACVAAGPRTRLNPLYTEGLERLRRRLYSTGQAINSLCTGAPPAVYQFSNLCKYFRISS